MTEEFDIQLAPMQGYTDRVYRNAFQQTFGGVDCFYTPFLRLEHETVPKRSLRDLEPAGNAVPRLVPQLIAATYAEAEKLVAVIRSYGYKEVDINLGCPFPALTKRQKGCGILPYPDKVESLLQIVKDHADLSFSVKMRLGYEQPEECMTLLPLLNRLLLRQVTMHARVGRQQYKGDCQLESFVRFAAGCRHRLLYNGDVLTMADIDRLRTAVPGMAGVMMGRGLMAHPWLAAEYKAGQAGDDAHRKVLLRKFHTALFDGYEQQLEGGEMQLLTKMKTLWEYLLPDADRKLLKKIHKAQRVAAYTEAVHRILL